MFNQVSSSSTTIYLFRTGQKTTSQTERPRDEKEMITVESASLSTQGVDQVKDLKMWIKAQQINFTTVISSSAFAAKETAAIALEGRQVDLEDNSWREIEIGSFEGKSAREIKEDFKKYHPGEKVPEDANECFYYPWQDLEGLEKKVFEPFKTTFRERILKAFAELENTYKGQTVAVFTHCEPIRAAVLLSKGNSHFFSTDFGRNIASLLPENPTECSLDSGVSLPQFKPEYASAVKFIQKDGQTFVDTTYRLTFRG